MKNALTILVLAAAIPLTMSGQQRPASTASQPVYLDPSKPIEQRVDDLISKLTLEEKASLLGTTAPYSEFHDPLRVHASLPVRMAFRLGEHGLARFAGGANELSACARCVAPAIRRQIC